MQYIDITVESERIEYIQKKCTDDTDWSVRALTVLYANQSKNGISFENKHRSILSSFADQVKAGRTLTEKQMVILAKLIPLYAGQLDIIAQNKEIFADN